MDLDLAGDTRDTTATDGPTVEVIIHITGTMGTHVIIHPITVMVIMGTIHTTAIMIILLILSAIRMDGEPVTVTDRPVPGTVPGPTRNP